MLRTKDDFNDSAEQVKVVPGESVETAPIEPSTQITDVSLEPEEVALVETVEQAAEEPLAEMIETSDESKAKEAVVVRIHHAQEGNLPDEAGQSLEKSTDESLPTLRDSSIESDNIIEEASIESGIQALIEPLSHSADDEPDEEVDESPTEIIVRVEEKPMEAE